MSHIQQKIKQLIIDIKTRPIKDLFKGLFMWASVLMSSIIISSLVLVTFPFIFLIDRQRHSLHALATLWAKIIQWFNPWWDFQITGRENLAPKNQPVIYVANHQSQADILAIFIMSTRFRWLSKASLFKIPLFGWAMSAVGYVPVNRGSKKSAEKCMRISARHLKKGTPMVFFPEGTRSKNGALGQFKNGAFRLAHSAGIPIVPITINGCATLLPKGSLLPKGAKVTIHIHEPIPSKDLSSEELMVKARNAILTQLDSLNESNKPKENT